MQNLKDCTKRMLYYTGYYDALFRLKKPASPRLLILMYHDLVANGTRDTDWTQSGKASRDEFCAQLDALANRFRIITVEQAIDEIHQTGQLTEPSAAITFDDGYLSTWSIAYPVMRERSIVGTVYIPSGWINREINPWWLVLTEYLRDWDPQRLSINRMEREIGQPLWSGKPDQLGSDRSRRHIRQKLVDYLRDLDEEDIETLLEKLRPLIYDGKPPVPEEQPMSWDQVREMADDGWEFGAHTVTHINMATADDDTIRHQVAESKAELERQINRPVRGFAYPYGMTVSAYARLSDLLHEQGFLYAVTASYGNNTGRTDRFLLRRTSLPLSRSQALLERVLTLDYLADPDEPSHE